MQHGFFTLVDGSMLDLARMAGSLVAYLDPGMGSYAVQLLLAGLFGGMFALKQSWADLKLRLAGWRGPEPVRSRSRAGAQGPPARPGVGPEGPPSHAPRSQSHARPLAEID